MNQAVKNFFNQNIDVVRNHFSQNAVTRGEESGMTKLAIDVSSAIARLAIKKTNDFFSKLGIGTSISDFCDNASRNEIVRLGLMQLNAYEHDVTMRTIGSDAAYKGDSRLLPSFALNPSYTRDINYAQGFTTLVTKDELVGDNTTRRKSVGNSSNFDDKTINQVYEKTQRLYYDDNDTGVDGFTNGDKMHLTNLNSILTKTKRLFQEKKVHTIISRFHTENAPEAIGEARTKYGLSHGRNLLTKDAERGQNTYKPNGYDNPYCRVWTHHYQYDKLMKRIRPFYKMDENGNVVETTIEKFHEWENFKIEDGWGWKNGNIGWDKSVLAGNHGFPHIVPKFDGGGARNVHTKQCMFSIENLAWKGYNPYEFEKALSWEQRGPNGGRIMWFPPYGISFTETTTTNWNNHTFIGRGEDVYTYSNTMRSGTLSFMLLVDHPSILNYISFEDQDNSKATDTDLLRFFAGCDSGSSTVDSEENIKNSLQHLAETNGKEKISTQSSSMTDVAVPTPLTDEYTEINRSEVRIPEKKEQPKEPEPEIPADPPLVYEFYVFYPNNYSGEFDRKGGGRSPENYPKGEVEPMAYLLAGSGAQMTYNSTEPWKSTNKPITFNELYDSNGQGYEMGSNGVSANSDATNVIVGPKTRWSQKPTKWQAATSKTWKYRVDGYYTETGSIKTGDYNWNTYDQVLTDANSYEDGRSYGLNSDASVVKNFFGEGENILVSFAEFAYAATSDTRVRDIINGNSINGIDESDKNMSGLMSLLSPSDPKDKREIIKVEIVGYSNSHGNNNSSAVNDQRNKNLAQGRANSIKDWLTETIGIDDKKVSITVDSESSKDAGGKTGVSIEQAKIWRSAKVTLTFKSSETNTLSESNTEPIADTAQTIEFVGYIKHIDMDGSIYFTEENGDGRRWVYVNKDGVDTLVFEEESKYYDRTSYNNWRNTRLGVSGVRAGGNNDQNKVRYDQEYHFFKRLKEKDPFVFGNLMKKIKYFDPAFHSMTPEGFNARLTFLSQCMRQGNTLTISDSNGKTQTAMANNLAFGRAPYCVLRLGDFYNQMIVIDNISINYDPLQWDLNTEGIGMQPLLANVNISFKFIGGGDLGGPVRRLQNAMSFNYYANARLYDNRADRMDYQWDERTNGAIDHDLTENSVFNDIAMREGQQH